MLADTYKVFDAAHLNIGATGALSATTLGSALSLLAQQTTLDGVRLNLEGATLLVPTASRVLAESIIPYAMADDLDVVADANLTSPTRFYVFADPANVSHYIYGGLSGEPKPLSAGELDWASDCVRITVAIDFGVCGIDYRGAVTGAGA